MNKTGKIKSTDTSEIFRQFQVNCIGENDTGKYYMLSAFGEDSNIPENTKALTTGSQNKDVNFVVGILNNLKTDDLNPGDKIIFSSSSDGKEIKSFIKLLNDGTIEVNGVTDINGNTRINGVIELNGNADNIAGFSDLKSGFDESVNDMNSAIGKLNQIIDALTQWIPVPNDGGAALKALVTGITQAIESTASIDSSKKVNLKTE